MRSVVLIAALAALLPCVAQAADCGPLKLVDRIQMTPMGTSSDLIPVLVDGAPRNFLFDTGGLYTQIGRSLAESDKLSIHQGNNELIDLRGKISRDQAVLRQFQFGHMRGNNVSLMISPNIETGVPFDGIMAPDYLKAFDIDVDFGTDVMNFFSPDHCDGAVVYWKAPVVVAVPVLWRSGHLTVPVTLDGKEIRAAIDTGAPDTLLDMDTAHIVYSLNMGDADTPESGILNGDKSLKVYTHVFKTLSFGDVAVINPHISIIPKAIGRNLDKEQLVGDRTKSEKDLIDTQDVIIGMNVLRKLHIYFAMKEDKLYISDASAPAQPAAGQ
jgi:hypothetical protein